MHKILQKFREGNLITRLWTGLLIYLFNWFVLLDQAVVTLLGFDNRLTVSALMKIFTEKKDCEICDKICDGLDQLDPQHCGNAWANWQEYRKASGDRSLWNIQRFGDLDA